MSGQGTPVRVTRASQRNARRLEARKKAAASAARRKRENNRREALAAAKEAAKSTGSSSGEGKDGGRAQGQEPCFR